MSERKARIMKEMAEELYQNARSIDALSGNMELREETIRHNNAHIVRLRGSVDQCHTRLEDKDAEIARLKEEVTRLNEDLVAIDDSCYFSDIDNMGELSTIPDRVEHLKQLYVLKVNHCKEQYFSAKASKLNAEKRKLLTLINKSTVEGVTDILVDYKIWLDEQAAKRKGKVTG